MIGIVGSFGDKRMDLTIRVLAILLSIMGTIVTAVENVNHYHTRGDERTLVSVVM